jgi:hypothetical protein
MKKLMIITALVLCAGVAFGQTMQKGGAIGIHEWTLKLNPDVTMNQFLELWENIAVPAMKKVIPEQTSFLLKGIGADNKFEYTALYYYNSIEDFNKYWGEDGPTEKGAAAMESYGPLLEEISKLGEFTYTAKDWIIIK